MIPPSVFVDNLELCEKYSKVSGCVVECGVWKGGMSAAMAEVFQGFKKSFLFDSFQGLPPAKEIDGASPDGLSAIEWQKNTDSPFYFDNCSADIHYAQEAMVRSGSKRFQIVKGWFKETLPSFDFQEPIAILRLDGDWYDSTLECLEHLFPKVAQGGIIIIDDYYYWDGCVKAVYDYLSKNKLSSRIHETKNGVAYIIKN